MIERTRDAEHDAWASRFDRSAEALVRPLDALRTRMLAAVGRAVAPLFADRDTRTLVFGLVAFAASFALATTAPLVVLALGPLVLGVPHLLADLRYLVFRPRLHTRRGLVGIVLVPLSALAFFVPLVPLTGVALLAIAIYAQGTHARRGCVALAGLALFAFGAAYGFSAEVALAHLHNVVAVLLFASVCPKGSPARRVLPLVFFVLAALIVAGNVVHPSAFAWFGDRFDEASLVYALGLEGDFDTVLRGLVLFAFAQSVHYAIFLRLLPEQLRERRAPRPFDASVRALIREVGRPLLGITALGTLFYVVAGYAELDMARSSYLRLALFHGPLELVLVGLAFAEARSPFSAASRP